MLWGLHTALFGFNQLFLAAALLGLSLGASGARLVGRRLTAVGLAGAGLLLVCATASPWGVGGVNPLAVLGLVGWLLWLVWIAGCGAALLRGTRRTGPVRQPVRPA